MSKSSGPSQAPPWNTTTPGDNQIPRFVTYTSPVSLVSADAGAVRATTLPLNLIAIIIGYLDDIADIARLTRTSRLLYYMTLPQLYRDVHLHSYPDVRYINGRPEGFGSGSPFVMALNGLVTRSNQPGMVLNFRVFGEWNESGKEDFAKGRIPDNSMMLNILLRAAVDRMTKLQSFCWELDCKPLKTLYEGLGTHNNLTSLTLKFPSSRLPRPSVMIPPMANLRVFKALDIDPLCYPDDFSVMLLHSRKLEDLRLHFSPRIRREAESSLNLETYFGRCRAAGYRMRLKHVGVQNFYGPNTNILSALVDEDTLVSMCGLDMFGGITGNVQNKFFDDTWKNFPLEGEQHVRRNRCNEIAEQHVTLLTRWPKLEELYVVNSQASRAGAVTTPSPFTPANSPDHNNLGKEYLYALTRYEGQRKRRLLLYDQWLLDDETIKDLAQHCPNLEELGLATDLPGFSSIQLIVSSLPKLYALRFVGAEASGHDGSDLKQHLEKTRFSHLRYIGLADRVFQLSGQEDRRGEWIVNVKQVEYDDVKHVSIWHLDNLDISSDPIAPFSP